MLSVRAQQKRSNQIFTIMTTQFVLLALQTITSLCHSSPEEANVIGNIFWKEAISLLFSLNMSVSGIAKLCLE